MKLMKPPVTNLPPIDPVKPTKPPVNTAVTNPPTKSPITPWSGQFAPWCKQPVYDVVSVDTIDQFERYGKFGYVIRVNIDQNNNPDPEKKFAILLNLSSAL